MKKTVIMVLAVGMAALLLMSCMAAPETASVQPSPAETASTAQPSQQPETSQQPATSQEASSASKMDGIWKADRTEERELSDSEEWYLVVDGDKAYSYPNEASFENNEPEAVYPVQLQEDGTAHMMVGEVSTSGNIPEDYFSVLTLQPNGMLKCEAYRDVFIMEREDD